MDSVGGGISQVATMLYNGAFFAGLELIEHQPHSLGDRYGRRRVFALGVGSSGVLSLACAVAPTTETLIAARALQGVAGGNVETRNERFRPPNYGMGTKGYKIGSTTSAL